jgi:hypothetical protein
MFTDTHFMGYIAVFTKGNGKNHCQKIPQNSSGDPFLCLRSAASGCVPRVPSRTATKQWGNRHQSVSFLCDQTWSGGQASVEWGDTQLANTAGFIMAHLSYPLYRGATSDQMREGLRPLHEIWTRISSKHDLPIECENGTDFPCPAGTFAFDTVLRAYGLDKDLFPVWKSASHSAKALKTCNPITALAFLVRLISLKNPVVKRRQYSALCQTLFKHSVLRTEAAIRLRESYQIPILHDPPEGMDIDIVYGNPSTGLHRQRQDVQVRKGNASKQFRDSAGVRVAKGIADSENIVYLWKNNPTFLRLHTTMHYFLETMYVQ